MLKPAIQIRSHDPNRQLITQTRELLNRAIKACFCSSFLVAGVTADGLLCVTCKIICPINLDGYLLYMNIIYLQFDKPDSSTKSEKCTYKRMNFLIIKRKCSTFEKKTFASCSGPEKAKIYPHGPQSQKSHACCLLI